MSEAPDIAILLDRFGPGGVERVACHLANGLSRRGWRVEMVVLSDSGPVRSLLDGSVGVRCLGGASRLPRGARLLAAVPALARYLRKTSPAVLHSPGNHTHVAAALAVRRAHFAGAFVPKITNPIIKKGMPGWKRGLRRLFYARAFAQAARILVLSQRAVSATAAIDAVLPRRSLFVHNPYVSDTMLEGEDVRRPADPPVILSVGRLSHQKDHATLLRAVALLKDRQWILRICGTGPEEAGLRRLAEEIGIADRLQLTGFVGDVVPEYRAATVMALSSRWEDLPATLVEAMACGCPVVSTRSSPAVAALLETLGAASPVPVGDPPALAARLADALNGVLPQVDHRAVASYGIEQACEEHAAVFAAYLSRPIEEPSI